MLILLVGLACFLGGVTVGGTVMWNTHKKRTAALAQQVRMMLRANNGHRAIRLLRTYEERK